MAMQTDMPIAGDWVETDKVAATATLLLTVTAPPVTVGTLTGMAAVPALPLTVTVAGSVGAPAPGTLVL